MRRGLWRALRRALRCGLRRGPAPRRAQRSRLRLPLASRTPLVACLLHVTFLALSFYDGLVGGCTACLLPCSARAVAQQQLYAFCAPSLGVRPLPRRVCASMCPSRMRSCLSIQISPPGLPPNGARGPTLPLCDGTMPTLPTKFLHCPEEYLHCPKKLISFLNCLFSVVDTCTAPIFYRNNLHCPVWVVNTCTAPGGGKKQPVLPISLLFYVC